MGSRLARTGAVESSCKNRDFVRLSARGFRASDPTVPRRTEDGRDGRIGAGQALLGGAARAGREGWRGSRDPLRRCTPAFGCVGAVRLSYTRKVLSAGPSPGPRGVGGRGAALTGGLARITSATDAICARFDSWAIGGRVPRRVWWVWCQPRWVRENGQRQRPFYDSRAGVV